MKLKDIIIGMVLILFFGSCGVNTNPSDNITFGQAFSHCASTLSYWLWLIPLGIVMLTGWYFTWRAYSNDQEWTTGKTLICFGLFALFMVSLFMMPAEIAANTTVEQAARGVFIGY